MQKPENEIFESAFKEAFEKANLAPPDIVWENIEKALPQGHANLTSMPEKTMGLQTKFLIGTGIVLVTGIAYFYLNDTSSINYKTNLNRINNETIITKSLEPANLDSELAPKKLASVTTFAAQKQRKINLIEKENFHEIPFDKTIAAEATDNLIYTKIEGNFNEMVAQKMKLPIIVLEAPSLEINADSQQIAPYFENTTIGQPLNEKGKFWQNFKVRGGIRVSNQ